MVVFICFLDLPRLIYGWISLIPCLENRENRPLLNLEHVSDGISCNVHTDWLWMGNAWKGACDDLQTRSARNAKCETSLNEKITRFNIPANLVGIRHLEGLAVATFAV